MLFLLRAMMEVDEPLPQTLAELPTDAVALILVRLGSARKIALVAPSCRALRDFEAQAHSPARPPLTSVAFPDKIGCGLAGGRWSDYLHEIEEFKRRNPLVRVIVIEYSE